jgi:hypothetical protein
VSEQTTYWGQGDGEELTHENPNDAIEDFLDDMHPTPFEKIDDFEVCEYRPMKPGMPAAHWSPLTLLLERWDEDYGNPDGDPPTITEAMRAAERAFVAAVAAEYRSWACEKTGNVVKVNALEWVRENRPEWLEDRKAASA